jgi:hypothetical protein
MRPTAEGKLDFTFIDKLVSALRLAGFQEVFVDKSGIKAGDNYETQIRRKIDECDLFLAVLGANWVNILRGKRERDERDDVVREIKRARYKEKAIVPLLVDGTPMVPPKELPEKIRRFHFQNGVEISSSSDVEAMATTFVEVSTRTRRISRLTSVWTGAYAIFGFCAWFCCGFLPNIVGKSEFGEAWPGMAAIWSGFYIWPILFLPFVLFSLYRPLTTLVEGAILAPNLEDRKTYLTPIVFGTFMAFLAAILEIAGPFETPWSIHPRWEGCGQIVGAQPGLGVLSKYGELAAADGAALSQYKNTFWMNDKCWPNVFFYLTVPVYEGHIDKDYFAERTKIRKTFVDLLSSGGPSSSVALPYSLSFSILAWLGCTGIAMSVFYVMVKIRRPDDDDVLRLPSEDAYLCLTYSFVTLMAWLPFRANTLYFKKLYFCASPGCSVPPIFYLNDGVIGAMLIISYIFVTVGLLLNYPRLALALLGAFSVLALFVCAFLIFLFGDDIASLSSRWQFYLGISIPSVLVMSALWYLFDPSYKAEADDGQEGEVHATL